MVAMYGYHATAAENVESIRKNGLEARQTSEHNYDWILGQPTGVYFLPEDDRSTGNGWGADGSTRGEAVVKINLLGLRVNQDPLIPKARYVPTTIPPERLQVFEPAQRLRPASFWIYNGPDGPEIIEDRPEWATFDELEFL